MNYYMDFTHLVKWIIKCKLIPTSVATYHHENIPTISWGWYVNTRGHNHRYIYIAIPTFLTGTGIYTPIYAPNTI